MSSRTEIIEKYLLGDLNESELIEFEALMKSDPELKSEVELQREMMNAALKLGLKAEFGTAIKQLKFKQKLIKGAWIGLALMCVMGTGYFMYNKFSTEDSVKTSVKPEALPDSSYQTFEIEDKDTIFETQGGVVVAIEAGTFKSNKWPVKIKYSEALTPLEIMEAGYSTVSGKSLLETGGMFSIEAISEGKSVSFNKPVRLHVPTEKVSKDMLLFEGKMSEKGIIDWVNPKPLSNQLQTVDLSTLDFYPEPYLPKLKSLKIEHTNKAFTDSLYYTFSGYRNYTQAPAVETKKSKERDILTFSRDKNYDYEFKNDGTIVVYDRYQNFTYNFKSLDEAYKYSLKHNKPLMNPGTLEMRVSGEYDIAAPDFPSDSSSIEYEIDPSRIRAIKDKRFQKTLIATKAFEERIRFIHTTCNPVLLDAYVDHLEWKMYEIDSLCETMTQGKVKQQFRQFKLRREGGVPISDRLSRRLKSYFDVKWNAYAEASRKVWNKTRLELVQARGNVNQIQAQINQEDRIRHNSNLREEYCLNIENACKQLKTENIYCEGKFPSMNYYAVNVVGPGTYNLDKYVIDATKKRSSLRYETEDGRVAEITYTGMEVSINGCENYKSLKVYLIPEKLSSFQRVLEKSSGVYYEKLNMAMKYDLVVIAKKGDQYVSATIKSVPTGKMSIDLIPINREDLNNQLNEFSIFGKQLERDLIQFEKLEIAQKKMQELEAIAAKRKEIAWSIFPCMNRQEMSVVTATDLKLK
ncbi:MAG TPA: hypothetical protein VGF79_10545 [Bacteroidia bacterium]